MATLLRAADDFPTRPLALQPAADAPAARRLADRAYQPEAAGGRLLDAYLPAKLGPDESRPVIVFVHGDAAPEALKGVKDWRCYRDYGRLAAAAGFVGITFNYRSSEDGRRLAEAEQDILDALAYVQTQKKELHADTDRVALWFFSGGGTHVALTLRTNLPGVRAVVGYYPVLFPDPRFLTPEQMRRFGASYHLSGDAAVAPPLLLVRCGFDSPFLNRSLDNFAQEALTKNFALELVNLPTAPHAFDVLQDTDEVRAVIRRTFDWARDRLR